MEPLVMHCRLREWEGDRAEAANARAAARALK